MDESKLFFVRCRAVILHEGKLLVVRHAHDASYSALPGGHLEFGEGVEECLSREIVEELGVAPTIGRLLYVNTFTKERKQPIEFFFEVTNGADFLHLADKERTHAFELAEVAWLAPGEATDLLPKPFADDFNAGNLPTVGTRFTSTLG